MNRRNHISTARELARELRFAHSQLALADMSSLTPAEYWEALQPDPALARRFCELLDALHFDGIRSRFFGELDPAKLILPIADDIASRLDLLADDLESQCAVEVASKATRRRDKHEIEGCSKLL